MAESSNRAFKYGILTRGEFRVLLILPSRDPSAEIHCHLLKDTFEAAEPYVALSYMWGSVVLKEQIIVNDTPFPVGKNLSNALRRMRQPEVAQRIWADAICINQSDIGEKNIQVAQMRNIYSRADRVAIWLGNNEHNVFGNTSTIAFIRVFTAKLLRPGYFEEDDGFQKDFNEIRFLTHINDVRYFLSGGWWSRMWVVQEVTVCKNPPVFYHGAETLEWDILLSFINEALSGPLYTNVYRRINLRHQGHGNLNLQFTGLKSTLMHVRELMKMRSIYQTDEVQTFSDLLIATKDRQSTDPKDKIFALLGLKSPGFPMKVDYNLTEAEVYINATVSALKEENRFDILDRIGCERFKSIKTLPSWVVDFGGRAGTILGKPIKSFSSHAREANNPSLYTAGGPTSRFDRSAVAYVKGASDSDHFLGVGSIIVDIIKKLGTTSPDMDEHLMGNSNGSIGSVIGNWKAVAASLPPLLTSPEQREKDFWRTVLLDLDMPEKNTNADLQDVEERRIPSHVDYLPPKNRSEEEYLVAMLNKKGGAQFSRNFGVTAAGGMGIFPENAKANDRICVFVGGRVPYVIRPWGQRFKLIGECYVDGMMDGEAIEWVRKGRCSTGVIWLV